MSVLRQRMLEDLRIRNFSPSTQREYVRQVARFSEYFGCSPMRLGPEEIRAYQLHLIQERNLSHATLRVAVSALRFFYLVTLGRGWDPQRIPHPRTKKKLPVVLSREEVRLLISSARDLRDRALLMAVYGTGARSQEVLHLQIPDLDGHRRVIRIRSGKGGKDRELPLFPKLHGVLREYYRQYRPGPWLFPGRKEGCPLSASALRDACQRARKRAGLRKAVNTHLLRHSYSTHLLEEGVDLRTIQLLLGHAHLGTVQFYTHLQRPSLGVERSSLDVLAGIDGDGEPS